MDTESKEGQTTRPCQSDRLDERSHTHTVATSCTRCPAQRRVLPGEYCVHRGVSESADPAVLVTPTELLEGTGEGGGRGRA